MVKHIVNEITASNKITIYPEDREILAHCFSIFQCRHPNFVKISDYVTKEVTLKDEKMIEFIKTEMAGECAELIAASVLHEQLKILIHPQTGIFVNCFKRTILKDKICLLRSKTSQFITSDSPQVNIYGIRNNVAYDLLGMPITPNLFLAFVDTNVDLNYLIDINNDEVSKINAYQLNRKAPTIFLSKDDILSEESCKQVIPDDNLLSDTEFLRSNGWSEDRITFCSKAIKHLFSK